MPTRLLFMMMAVLLLLPSCTVQIKNFQSCSPYPDASGATCDDFLDSNQQNLTELQWSDWQVQNAPIDCVTSSVIGDLKAEIEKLCSLTPCSKETKEAVDLAIKGLDRMIEAGRLSKSFGGK